MKKNLLITAFAALLLLGSAPSLDAQSGYVLWGLIGRNLATIDLATGQATLVTPVSTPYGALGNMAYDPTTDNLFAIAERATNPRLLIIDRNTGATTDLGLIDRVSPTSQNYRICDALTYFPLDNQIYGGFSNQLPANGGVSNRLATVDKTTAGATQFAGLSGTCQNDADDLFFANDTLYCLDGCTNQSRFYRVNRTTGVATQIGNGVGFKSISQVVFDPVTNQVFLGKSDTRQLYSLNRTTAIPTLIGNTHTSSDFGGATLLGLAFAPPPAAAPVPTLSEWGLILLSILVLAMGTAAVWKSRYQTQYK